MNEKNENENKTIRDRRDVRRNVVVVETVFSLENDDDDDERAFPRLPVPDSVTLNRDFCRRRPPPFHPRGNGFGISGPVIG